MALFTDLEKAILKVLHNAESIGGRGTYEVDDHALYELQEEFNIYFRESYEKQEKRIPHP